MRNAAPDKSLSLLLCAGILFIAVFRNAAADTPDAQLAPLEITLSRVFGSCSDEYSGVTDFSEAVGECGIIQVIINKFNVENPYGAKVITQSTQSGGYYDRLGAAFAARRPPDIALIHQNMLPDFVRRRLLLPLKRDLAQRGVAWQDFVPSAQKGVTFDGEIYALPFDLHALLWHINLDLFDRAGLLGPDGRPIFPASPGELLQQAKQVKERTGKRYFAIPSLMDPMPVWTYETWVWQQGADLITLDQKHTFIQAPASAHSLELLSEIYRQGHANRGDDYTGAEQAFLRGEAAVLVNGTWVVDGYLDFTKRPETKLKRYGAYLPPRIFQPDDVAWSGSHTWALPRQEHHDPRKLEAALGFLKFLYDYSGQWAKTGHLPVRRSVLKSPWFQSLPLRKEYMAAAVIARSFPQVENQRAIQTALGQELNATWLRPRPAAQSLKAADEQIQEVLKRSRRLEEREKESASSG